MAHVLEKPRHWLFAYPEIQLSPQQYEKWASGLEKLLAGVPLPYVLGEWEFYGRKFQVSPAVLIPRPETELLVERALEWLARHPDRRRVVDIGTGSGVIALTLAAEIPDLVVTAVDISAEALAVARQNGAAHALEDRISWVQTDLLAELDGPFDLITANLPYIPSETLRGLKVFQTEPGLALDGGVDGLDLIERLLAEAGKTLAPGAALLLEIEAGQGESARKLAAKYFPNADVQVKSDYAGRPRLMMIETLNHDSTS
jgi:release factor glutamine methyltransferase